MPVDMLGQGLESGDYIAYPTCKWLTARIKIARILEIRDGRLWTVAVDNHAWEGPRLQRPAMLYYPERVVKLHNISYLVDHEIIDLLENYDS